MKPLGEDTAQAIREWLKDEIKDAPKARLELGKFFFTVSSASLGAVVSLSTFGHALREEPAIGAALVALFVSLLVALLMVVPKVWPLSPELDLFAEHRRQVRQLVALIWLWFTTWLTGVVFGIYAFLFT